MSAGDKILCTFLYTTCRADSRGEYLSWTTHETTKHLTSRSSPAISMHVDESAPIVSPVGTYEDWLFSGATLAGSNENSFLHVFRV